MFILQLQNYKPIIIVPTFSSEKHEKHRGGASRQGARSPRKRLPTQYLIPLATANIVTLGSQGVWHFYVANQIIGSYFSIV